MNKIEKIMVLEARLNKLEKNGKNVGGGVVRKIRREIRNLKK